MERQPISAAQQLIKEIEFRNRLRGIIEARGCGLNELTAMHWRITGKRGDIEFFPTTGTIHSNASGKVKRGVKGACNQTVIDRCREACQHANGGK
ncbi:hypothetical protein VPHK225_0044 [Vibrio phage K225]|nr:hypothetical protein PODOV044v1_p0040 [Vibrio phage 23E28.1]